ncbi:MAG TPA: hypothetical protein VIQ24_13515 [Pyrinomonadaceae bacterium]
MGRIAEQVHGKFKVFAGPLNADDTIGALADEISGFVRDSKAAAKSIGVEYLESAGRLIITLGYRDDEEAYPVKISSVSLGKIETLGGDFDELERKMTEASARFSNIICHELYVTGDHDFMMIFMTHEQ